jgi:hypothetical protein
MKTKIFIIIILTAVALVAIIYDRKNIPEISKSVVKEDNAITQSIETVTINASPVSYKQAITVLRTPQKVEKVVPEANDAQNSQNMKSPTVSSRQNSSVVNVSTSDIDSQEPAGVTILGKYPTKEEVKEMNSRGIVIY